MARSSASSCLQVGGGWSGVVADAASAWGALLCGSGSVLLASVCLSLWADGVRQFSLAGSWGAKLGNPKCL